MHSCIIQHNFRCSEYLCKLGKEDLNALTCKFYAFSIENSATIDKSHAFLPLTIAKVINPQNSPLFWPTLHIQMMTLDINITQKKLKNA